MKSNRLYVINASTLVSDSDLKKIVTVCNRQIADHVAPAWGKARVIVEFHTGKELAVVQKSVAPGSYTHVLLDSSDQQGALGWHDLQNDYVYGESFAGPCLQAGSTATTGPYAVSLVLSHEFIETLLDPYCNGWCDSGRGFLVAAEGADPVEADGYEINGIQVSDFILPAYFDPQAVNQKYDYLGKLTQPFSMSKGAYWIQMKSGTESQKFADVVNWQRDVGFDLRENNTVVFSPEMPEWKRELKLRKVSRNTKKRALAGAR